MLGSESTRCSAGAPVFFLEAQLLVLEESVRLQESGSWSTAPTGFSGLGERGQLGR